jgi:hypothetical protein
MRLFLYQTYCQYATGHPNNRHHQQPFFAIFRANTAKEVDNYLYCNQAHANFYEPINTVVTSYTDTLIEYHNGYNYVSIQLCDDVAHDIEEESNG